MSITRTTSTVHTTLSVPFRHRDNSLLAFFSLFRMHVDQEQQNKRQPYRLCVLCLPDMTRSETREPSLWRSSERETGQSCFHTSTGNEVTS